jgi:hypothetical protein
MKLVPKEAINMLNSFGSIEHARKTLRGSKRFKDATKGTSTMRKGDLDSLLATPRSKRIQSIGQDKKEDATMH